MASPFNPTVAVSDQWTGAWSSTVTIFSSDTPVTGLITVAFQNSSLVATSSGTAPPLGEPQDPATDGNLTVNVTASTSTSMTVPLGGSNTIFASNVTSITLTIPSAVEPPSMDFVVPPNASGHYSLNFNYCTNC